MNKRFYQLASRLVVLAIACMAVPTFVACGDDNDDDITAEGYRYPEILGTWECTWSSYGGVECYMRFTFQKDGTGQYSAGYNSKDGESHVSEFGEITYQMDWREPRDGSLAGSGDIVGYIKGEESDVPTKKSWCLSYSGGKVSVGEAYGGSSVFHRVN